MIDIFLEKTYKSINISADINLYIIKVWNLLYSKKYTNVRLHYTDFRLFFSNKNTRLSALIHGLNFVDIPRDEYIKYLNEIKGYFEKVIGQNTYELMYNTYNGTGKLRRQYDKCNPMIRDKILQFLTKKHGDMITKDKIINDINILILELNNNKLELNYIKNKSKNIFGKWFLLVLDTYISFRMFRSFRNIGGKYSLEPYYIIEFTGDFHIDIRKELLEYLEFELNNSDKNINITDYNFISSISDNNFQCISINNFIQPLFAYNYFDRPKYKFIRNNIDLVKINDKIDIINDMHREVI
jgi:hypothetical protein